MEFMQPTVQQLFVQHSCVLQVMVPSLKAVVICVVSMRLTNSRLLALTSDTPLSLEKIRRVQLLLSALFRLIQNDAEATRGALKGFVLISLPEMYYILSESLYDSNKTEAISLLNQVRKSRGLGDVDAAKVATRTLFEQEMMRERVREFPWYGSDLLCVEALQP